MKWLKRHKAVEALVDPSSGQLSMSRIVSWWFFVLDAVWAVACIWGIPPKDAYAPVSSMLAVCTGAAFGAYGLNSFGGSWRNGSWGVFSQMVSNAPEPPQERRERVKPKV